MFDFGKNDENLTEKKVKEYFKENNFFGIENHVVMKANEIKVFSKNYVVEKKSERTKAEKLLKQKGVTDLNFPFSVCLYDFNILFYTKRTRDFAKYIPNSNKIHLYLFRKLQ